MSSRLIGSLATTEALASAFSDRALLQAMVDFESALARAQAGLGLVPRSAAEAIGRAAHADRLDLDAIVAGTRANATASIPMVRALEARVEATIRRRPATSIWGPPARTSSIRHWSSAFVRPGPRSTPITRGSHVLSPVLQRRTPAA